MIANLEDILRQQADVDRRRMRAIADAWQLYEGQAPPPLKRRDGKPDDNVILNLAGLIVDAGVDFLFGEDLVIDVDGEADAGELDFALGLAWGDDLRMVRLQQLATNGAVAGQAVVRIHGGERDGAQVAPRVIVLDPGTLSVVTDPDDEEVVLAYVLDWRARRDRRRQIIQPEGAGWLITDQKAVAGTEAWQPLGETMWDFDWPPIVAAQNLPRPNCWWGRPDLTADVIATQDAVNRSLSTANRLARLHGHPKPWAKGIGPDQELSGEPDEVIVLPDGDSELGQLQPAANISEHLELYRAVKAALHEISRVPEIAGGRLDNIGQLSGLALRILYGPLVRKTQTKRRLYGSLIAEASRRVLDLIGAGPDHDVTLRWPEILPSDPVEEAQAAEAKQRAGVSRATTLGEMGYDAQEEEAKRGEEKSADGESLMAAFNGGREQP